jgi:DNA mismatch endonuclease, patch repair protein
MCSRCDKCTRDTSLPEKLSRNQRSQNMAAVRGKDTKPELQVRSMLHGEGYRFRLHRKDLPGKPDIVLPSRRIVIFVNGCFWHCHSCPRGRSTPTKNALFWSRKRSETIQRDLRNQKALKGLGWKVIVLWECAISSHTYQVSLLRQLARQ